MSFIREILTVLLQLYVMTYVLRIAMSWQRVNTGNPLAHFVYTVTNPVVGPLRRVVPTWRGSELAPLVALLAVQILATLVLLVLAAGALPGLVNLLRIALISLILTTTRIYFFIIIVRVLISWISPGTYNPMSSMLVTLSEPLLRPVRRLIPPIGGFDLSPLIVLIVLGAITGAIIGR